MRALLDTNVILDFLLDRPPFADAATAVQHAAAAASQVDAIVTRDTRDYAGAALTVLSPQDFLDQLNRQA